MNIPAFCLVIAVAGATFAAGQEAPAAQAPSPRPFKLDLRPLYAPGYGAAHELRLALWDSPMSRLELAASSAQWAVRNPGPTGGLVPFQVAPLPFRFRFEADTQPLVLGPWSPRWDQLTWQDKVTAGVQDGFLAWLAVQIVRHAH